MPIIKLTKTVVENIKHSLKGQPQTFYVDSRLKGFGLRVGKSAKTYYAEKRVNGKTVRVTIGEHGQVTSEQAWNEAQRLLGLMSSGINPNDEKKHAIAKGVTLKEAFKDFLNARKSLKPRTIYDYERTMDFCFSDWQNKQLISISKDMISKRHEKIGKTSGGAYANLSMRVLRAIFNFAKGQYEDAEGNSIISHNPVTRLSQTRSWYRVEKRITVIKPHELKAFFEGLNQLRDISITTKAEVVRDYIILLLFTGLRRQEAAKLKWEEVDFESKTLTVKDTKNHDSLTLPLSDYLYDMFIDLHKSKTSVFVFPGEGETGHIVEPRRQIDKVKKLSGVSFTIHDLRRTFITIAESLDISSYAVKRLVNHKMSGDVTAGYIIHDVERLRKPMQQITDYILKKAGIMAEADVVKLNKVRHKAT